MEAEVLRTSEEHTTLLDKTEAVWDLQCAWIILFLARRHVKLPLEGGAPLQVRGIRSAP